MLTGGRNDSWLAAALDDLVWNSDQLPFKLQELLDPHACLKSWLDLIVSSYWDRLVGCALAASIKLRKEAPTVQTTQSAVEAHAGHICYECGREFGSWNDLVNHAHRSHSYISPTRLYAPSTTCLVCLTTSSARIWLTQHLQNRKECLKVLEQIYEPMDRAIV